MVRKRYQGAAEQELLEKGVITQHSGLQRDVLGCVACRCFGLSQDTYPARIARCTGRVGSASITHFLDKLVAAGALKRATQPVPGADRPARCYYVNPTTSIGQALALSLEEPTYCPLEVAPEAEAADTQQPSEEDLISSE